MVDNADPKTEWIMNNRYVYSKDQQHMENIYFYRLNIIEEYNFNMELFQLQMGLSFPLLRANNLRSSLLNIRACSFLISCT